ncbi:hypothetical protein [uncultured Methylobacterium sp.]|uniref:hypothetical protein n=1 Tax=uncultured Methylobacterium sp. TaxID=157278 RepID=UPI0035C96072
MRTPDGRYIIVRGRLWRCTDPTLSEEARRDGIHALMDARRAVRAAKRATDAGTPDRLAAARRAVQAAKEALGERGPVWWRDGAPDETRTLARNSSYAAWFAGIAPAAGDPESIQGGEASAPRER